MMRFLMISLWLVTVVPALVILLNFLPEFANKWKGSGWFSRILVPLSWLCLAIFLVGRPHDDNFTGLDNTAYRKMANAFLQGRGLHDEDDILKSVPDELRRNMLYRRGPGGRPTRDLVFQLNGWRDTSTKPFFVPTLPLVAAGQGLFSNPDMFIPMMGSIWIGLLLVICFTAGGGWGVLVALALLTATAWPAWFLRGYYPEAVGALLVGMSLPVLTGKVFKTHIAAVASFALGFSVCFHPIMLVVALPPFLILLFRVRGTRTTGFAILSFVLGVLPFVAFMKWVCQPYGDVLSLRSVVHLVKVSAEHRVVAGVVLALSVAAVVVFGVFQRESWRARIGLSLARTPSRIWLALAVLPAVLFLLPLGAANTALVNGGLAIWNGVGISAAALFFVAFVATIDRKQPVADKLLAVILCWTALLFIFIKGIESPVGIWSQRRFLPVIIIGISLFAVPLARAVVERTDRRAWILVAAFLVLTGGWNMANFSVAYRAVNEEGSTEFVDRMAGKIGEESLVVFDYFPHSVPYAAGLQQKVLGLGEDSKGRWPETSDWLARVAQTQEVWLVTSWSPTVLEDGYLIEPLFSATGTVSYVNTKVFYPAVKNKRKIVNHFARAIPVGAEIGRLRQEKVLDGSPIGLRGTWGQMSDSAWTRQSSGIIGPIPEAGGRIRIVIECAWFPPEPEWKKQNIQIVPPWGGEPSEFCVSNEYDIITVTMMRPQEDSQRSPTGAYKFTAVKPYDPAVYGLNGYDGDLGVLIRRVVIEHL